MNFRLKNGSEVDATSNWRKMKALTSVTLY